MKKLVLIVLLAMWGCKATPENVASKACDCKRAELEITYSADEAARVKLTEIAQKKTAQFNQDYPDLKSDKEFFDAYKKELAKCYKVLEKEFDVEIK